MILLFGLCQMRLLVRVQKHLLSLQLRWIFFSWGALGSRLRRYSCTSVWMIKLLLAGAGSASGSTRTDRSDATWRCNVLASPQPFVCSRSRSRTRIVWRGAASRTTTLLIRGRRTRAASTWGRTTAPVYARRTCVTSPRTSPPSRSSHSSSPQLYNCCSFNTKQTVF